MQMEDVWKENAKYAIKSRKRLTRTYVRRAESEEMDFLKLKKKLVNRVRNLLRHLVNVAGFV